MTTESYNGIISTDGEFKTVSSLTGFSFTQGTIYTLQAVKPVYVKLADAIILITNGKPFQFKAGADDLYIKVNYGLAPLTILEGTT